MLSAVIKRLNRWTLVEYKSPIDLIEQRDLNYLIGCAHLYCAQQAEPISREDLSLILLAPAINEAFREAAGKLDWTVVEEQAGVHRIDGPVFATWMIESDRLAGAEEPVLTLFSRVFLRQRQVIIEQFRQAGFEWLLEFMLQLVQQFQAAGEAFMIQHKDVETMNEMAQEIRESVLRAIPPEERLKGIPPEERLKGIPPAERLKGLSDEELAQLRSLLEQQKESE